MLNAGVIGMGIGEKHALAYQNHPNASLKTFCDIDLKKIELLKSKFPKSNAQTDAQTLLEDDKIDILSICSYDNYHSSQIIKAFKAGKHVMAEKPLCLDQSEMLAIYKTQKQNPDTKLSSNLVLRTNPRFRKLRKKILAGEFGDIFYIEGDYYWGRKTKLFGWRAEMDFYSIILGAAIHMIDLVIWMLGDKPVSVQASGNNISTKNSKLEYNSFGLILLNFSNGIIVKITGNGGCIHPHFHGLKIYGTKQTAIHNLNSAYYINSRDSISDFSPIIEPYPEKRTREKIIFSFVDSILNDSMKPLVCQQDVYDVMSVCFAAEEAMNTGEKVKVQYLK